MLTEQQKKIIIETFMPYKPSKLGIFGSYARNEASDKSDIDILYSLENTVGLFKLITLKETLEKRLNKHVDLVSEKYINKNLKSLVFSDLQIIYKNE